MLAPELVLSSIPVGLRGPLLAEYNKIVQAFMERCWQASELSGGLFSEIVYTILDGHAKGIYASKPSKPSNMVDACRALEKNKNVPRSFQILIPRMLPPLYEIRNQRNVGHVGGDVNPNHMDSTAVLSMTSRIMAELVRVLHNLPTLDDAQTLVDSLVERRTPLIWQSSNMKRVLNPKMAVRDQIIVLAASVGGEVSVDNLLKWTEASTKPYLKKLLNELHDGRLIEFDPVRQTVQVLPPGADHAAKIHRQ
jgi:hypothetical protein